MHRTLPLPGSRTALAKAGWAAAALFALLAADLLLHGPVSRVDAAASAWVRLHVPAAVLPALALVTQWHSTAGLLAMALLAAAVLAWQGQRHWLPVLAASVPGALLLNAGVKLVFHRPRPLTEHPFAVLASFSFPSGHATGATAWWGFLAIAWCAAGGRRAPAVAVAALMAAVVALSRVALGAHYLGDVAAGMAEGVAWLALCFSVAGALGRRSAAHVARA